MLLNARAQIRSSPSRVNRAKTAGGGAPIAPKAPEAVAGAEGFEPPLAVLETAGLPLNLRPYIHLAPPIPVYLISLWGWCFRQNGQNFFNSTRSVMVFLFFMLV